MSLVQGFAVRFLLPAIVGGVIAISILTLAPHWVYPERLILSAPLIEEEVVVPPTEVPVTPPPVASGPVSYADAVASAAPAVVNIYTRKRVQRKTHPLLNDPAFQRFFRNSPQPSERMQSSLGSGVIMSENGYIITNYHVVNGADEIVVSLHDGREANATITGTDPEADLAVLHVNLQPLPVITKAAADKVRVGDVVLAIGNPFGVGQTVTMGIVSATGRNRVGLNTFENYIQTDAAINPGNSGGALINALGQLVGINTAIYSQSGGSEGIGFAIPAHLALRAPNDIAKYGTTIRGWLGIEVQEATPELLTALKLPGALTGLLVTGIFPDGPASQAGLKVGDIILSINGEETSNARAAMNRIAELRPGDEIAVEYLRAGKTATTRAIAGRRQTK